MGLPPGTLIYTGHKEDSISSFQLYVYNKVDFKVFEHKNIEVILSKVDPDKTCWLKVVGLNRTEQIQTIGDKFNISSLVLEDILDLNQRPKCNIFENYTFFSLKMSNIKFLDNSGIHFQQISILLTKNIVITFQENKQNTQFNKIITRLEKNDSLLRAAPTDFLFYRMLDTIVDYYYVTLDSVGDKIEDLEINITEDLQDNDLQRIQHLKRGLITLRRNVYPVREAISLFKKESDLISEKTRLYLTDVYEHTIHAVETIETYRDLTSGLMDLYMTAISNRMNEIMKVLTIIATIFIPLTFIAGVYGMNFKYMPELDYKWAYPIALLIMIVIALGMLRYFKKKRWL